MRKEIGLNSIDGGKGILTLTFTRKVKECQVMEADEFGVSVRVSFHPDTQDATKDEDLEKGKIKKKTFTYGVCHNNLFRLVW